MRDSAHHRPRRVVQRRREPEQMSHERWLVSYADFITLMFAFFLTMYAASTVDAQKLKSIVDSLGEAFHPGRTGATQQMLAAAATPVLPSLGQGAGDLRALEGQLRTRFARALAEKKLDIEFEKRGLVISIREAGSFAVGSADLPVATQTLLGDLGQTLSALPNPLRVEGHTDDVPIHTARFASNWELSTARATSVVAYFLAHAGIRPDSISASGYGEFHPRVPNTSDDTRARNRRVDVVVLNPATGNAEEPHPGNECR